MPLIVGFDSGPLGLITKAAGKPGRDEIRRWFERLKNAGVLFAVPGIVRYELRRELLLHNASRGLARPREFESEAIVLRVTQADLDRAAEFWATARRGGFAGASDDSLDADCILAAQVEHARGTKDTVVIATDNLRHFANFPGIDARRWQEIEP